jgi:hypothetical protein
VTLLRVIAGACSACCLIAIWALYQPWHQFHDTSWNMCWGPDCGSGSGVSDYGVISDTGFSHTGIAPVVVLAIASAVALAAAVVPRRPVRLVAGIATLTLVIAAGALTLKATLLAHMLDHTQSLFGETLCALAGLFAASTAVALIAVRDATAVVPGRSA